LTLLSSAAFGATTYKKRFNTETNRGDWVVASMGASDVGADVSNFDGNLSATDDTVQKALETLDELTASITYPSAGIAVSTGSGWGTSITDNSTNWNTAYGWGNHASEGYVTGTPWTSEGYLTSLAFSGLSDYPADAAGVLTNNGAGVLSWEVVSGYSLPAGLDNQGVVYYNGSDLATEDSSFLNWNTTSKTLSIGGTLSSGYSLEAYPNWSTNSGLYAQSASTGIALLAENTWNGKAISATSPYGISINSYTDTGRALYCYRNSGNESSGDNVLAWFRQIDANCITDTVRITNNGTGNALNVIDGSTSVLSVNGDGVTTAADLVISDLTASKPVFTDANKNLVSTGTLGVDQGGTGITAVAAGSILVANSANTISAVTSTSGTKVCTNTDGTISWETASSSESPFTTGDVKLTLKTTADSGWVLMNDTTIGDASSGATGRANADTEALFTLLWNNTLDANCPVVGGRGASAAADYAAHKKITLPKTLGRALAVYGSGSGLTARALAATTGTETHTLSTAEMPSHTHAFYVEGSGINSHTGINASLVNSGNSSSPNFSPPTAGSGSAHANMQPTVFLNVMIKL